MRGRKQDSGGADVLDVATVHCAMCGAAVPFTEDGRCDLGHRVTLPTAEPVEAVQAEAGPAAPPAAAAAATPPPSAAAPEARDLHEPSGDDLSDDPFFHPYDEVLAEEAPAAPADPVAPAGPVTPAGPVAAPIPEDPAPAEGLAPEELEELLSWDDGTADLDVDLASELGDDET